MILLDGIRGHRVFVPVLLAPMCGLAARRDCCPAVAEHRLRKIGHFGCPECGANPRWRPSKNPSGAERAILPSSPTVICEMRAWKVTPAQQMLRLGVRVGDDRLICTTAAAGRASSRTASPTSFRRQIKGAKMPRVRFHDLRHSHATHMLASGVHVKVASARLGHTKVGLRWTSIATSCRECRRTRLPRWTRLFRPPSGARKPVQRGKGKGATAGGPRPLLCVPQGLIQRSKHSRNISRTDHEGFGSNLVASGVLHRSKIQ